MTDKLSRWCFRCLLAAAVWLTALQATAVEIYSWRLNSSGGLPDNNVRNLTVDAQGLLWLGTPNGLYRYDGYAFTAFRRQSAISQPGLANNHITGCYALADSTVLISQQGGMMSLYDTRTGRFAVCPDDALRRRYDQARRTSADSALLARRASQLLEMLRRGSCSLINDNLGNMVVIDRRGGITFVDRKTGECIPMRVFDETLFPLVSSLKYKVLTSERRQLIWVSTNGCGITVYDRRSHTTQTIRATSGLISTDNILDICLDKDDNVWAADEFHGLVHLSTTEHHVETHLLTTDSRELRANQVYIMHWTGDSTLLVANTRGDVYEADRQWHMRQTGRSIDMHALCIDNRRRIWTGTRTSGLLMPESTRLAHGDEAVMAAAGTNVNCLLADNEGRIWAGFEQRQKGDGTTPTAGRLVALTPDEDDGSTYHAASYLPVGASPKALIMDHQGHIWAGGAGGLFSFRPDELISSGGKALRQWLTPDDLEQQEVNCIYEDHRQHIWVGTNGNGLFRYDLTASGQRALVLHMTTREGLIANEVQSIIEDKQGKNLWVATKRGITRLNPETGERQYIFNEHNLLQNYYADNSACQLGDDRIAFGTYQGIVVYDVNPTTTDSVKPLPLRLTLTDFVVGDVSVSEAPDDRLTPLSPELTRRLVLSHDQNTFTVRFSTLNFGSLAATRYVYWLERYDEGWSEPTGYSFASYKNVPPGRYVLHVRAIENNTGKSAERRIDIVVRSPWWTTWWAWLMYLAAAAVIAWFVYRQLRTIYSLRRRISIERELTEFKLQFFTNVSHEFRTPLTIIRGAMNRIQQTGDIPASLRQPLSNMQKSSNRMLRLVNQFLEFRKMQNGKLRLALEQTDVVEFVRQIYLTFSDVAENKQISYTFLPDVKTFTTYIDRQHVDKMLYNLLSNAFKYTPAKGTVTLRLTTAGPDRRLRLSVTDTGVGIPKEKQGELFQRFMQSTFTNNSIGIGLHLTKALADVHHGTIRFEENQPSGAIFTIELPTDESVYAPDDFLQESQLEQPAPEVPEADYQELMGEPMNDRHVLIVEDDSDVADFLRQTLQPYFAVDVAMDGKDALERLAQSTFHLVVSDVMMPIMDGYQLTEQIRRNPATQAIPVLLLTALDSADSHVKGLGKGADAYLTKPFNPRLLIATCRQLMQQRLRLQQAYAGQTVPGTAAVLPEIIVDERDKQLLDKMDRWLYDHLADPSLSVDDMADAMGYGRSVFFRKVKALTGQTPAEYVRMLRMTRAAELLRDETITVAEVAYKVGINEPHYFTKVFKQQFGVTPKRYQQGVKQDEPEEENAAS